MCVVSGEWDENTGRTVGAHVSENLYGVLLTRVICSNFTCQMLLGM